MTVLIISKTSWNVQTIKNVTSITLANYTYTITGDSTVTAPQANYYVRIMES